jgi:hypothetical protein
MPSRCDSAFMRAAQASSEPAMLSPIEVAMSLADLTMMIFSALSSVRMVPTG